MHAKQVLHKVMRCACTHLHQKRFASLFACSEALLHSQVLTVTHIGRAIDLTTTAKHNIKRADRLLSNVRLQGETFESYGGIVKLFCSGATRPIIVVDWSDLSPDRSYYLLRASLALEGRAITLYEEVHTSADGRETHRRFLDKLKKILPPCARPKEKKVTEEKKVKKR